MAVSRIFRFNIFTPLVDNNRHCILLQCKLIYLFFQWNMGILNTKKWHGVEYE